MDQRSVKFAVLVGMLGTLSAFGPLSIDMYLPAFPRIAAEFATSVSTVQLSLASFFIGLATGQLVYGPMVDRFGRKPPVYFGLTTYVLASLICASAPSTEVLIGARFLQALGACGGFVASRAIVRDLFDERNSARVFSLLMLVMGIAPILAPLVGGYVAAAHGWRAIFYVLALFSFCCLLAVIRWLPETKGAHPSYQLASAFRTYASIVKSRRFMGLAMAGGLAQAGMFAYITGSPFVFIGLFAVPPEQYGWIFGGNAVGLILATQVNVRLLRSFPPERILRYAFTILAVSGFAVVLASVLELGFIALLLPIFTFISVLGLTFPNTSAAALASEGARAGTASALLGTLQFTFAALASLAVSSFDNGSSRPMAATMAVCASLAWISFRSTPPRSQSTTA